jgi:hypothetical protein
MVLKEAAKSAGKDTTVDGFKRGSKRIKKRKRFDRGNHNC